MLTHNRISLYSEECVRNDSSIRHQNFAENINKLLNKIDILSYIMFSLSTEQQLGRIGTLFYVRNNNTFSNTQHWKLCLIKSKYNLLCQSYRS